MAGPAPHLDEYFKVQTELMGAAEDVMADPLAAILIMSDPTKLKDFRADQAKKVEQLREIAAKSFDHHDTSNDGVLQAEESQAFFMHFAERLVPFTTKTACTGVTKMCNQQMEQYRAQLGDNEAKVKEVEGLMADALKQAQEQIVASFKERGEAYTSDKAAKDAAAFAVLDKNGDGKLTKEMVVEGLTPKTEIHYAFMVALGMSTKEEVEEEKQAEVQHEAMIMGAQAGAKAAAGIA